MKINHLLEELILIAKKSKTDFAISMNMTPSGLSKILTGSRLPGMKEKKAFTKLAADYFADNIYSQGCYLKLRNLFPIIYDFSSVDELRSFFSYAINYALDKELAAANHVNLDFAERGFYFLGRKPMLNLLCVMLSDCITDNTEVSLELYSSFPHMDPAFSEIFNKIRITNPDKCNHLTLNHFFDGTMQEATGMGNSVSLPLINQLQNQLNLNLWVTESHLGQSFLLVKGMLLLMFNLQIDGTPLMTPISNKNYLNVFHKRLLKRDIKKVSYSRDEAAAYLECNPDFISSLTRQGIDHIYSLTSIGYLQEKEKISALTDNAPIAAAVSEIFNCILTGKSVFNISLSAMERFSTFGKAIIPLVGAFSLLPEQRTSYLKKYHSYLKEESSSSKVKILNSNLSNLFILCSGDLGLVYSVDDKCERERIHVFEASTIRPVLESMALSEDTLLLDFSMELWSSYQGDLFREHS